MFLSEHNSAGDILRCQLGNLPAGDTAVLSMSYVVELSVEADDICRFVLPAVLKPRYCPGTLNTQNCICVN